MCQARAHMMSVIVHWPGCMLKEIFFKRVFSAAMFLIPLQMLLSR